MGKDKQALSKSFTREDLSCVIEETARKTAEDTVKAIEDMNKRNERRADPGKAAQRMLSEYRRLKIAVKEDIEINEAEGLEMRWQYLKDLMGSPDHALLTEEAAYARERRSSTTSTRFSGLKRRWLCICGSAKILETRRPCGVTAW